MKLPSDRAWALLFCRSIIGLIFFMAGLYKCFVMTPIGHARHYFVAPYADTFLPTWSLWAAGAAVPVIELVAGGLVLVGFKTRPALLFMHVIPRLGLLTVVLLLPREEDVLSVDGLLRSRRSRT
jgi:uncharacterized membrane protein YphA (DoxX/SURF4 family)